MYPPYLPREGFTPPFIPPHGPQMEGYGCVGGSVLGKELFFANVSRPSPACFFFNVQSLISNTSYMVLKVFQPHFGASVSYTN